MESFLSLIAKKEVEIWRRRIQWDVASVKIEEAVWQGMWTASSSWQQAWLTAGKETGASIPQLKGSVFCLQPGNLEENPRPQRRAAILADTLVTAQWDLEQRIQLYHAQTFALQHWMLIHGCCFKLLGL